MIPNEPDFLHYKKSFSMEKTGMYDFPVVKGCRLKCPENVSLIGFNYATNKDTCDRDKKLVHFFLPDYRFEQVWNNPDRYIDLFREYKGILTPDFSQYVGMSRAMQIWNSYRMAFISNYYQSKGVHVMPSLTWSDEESYKYCFDWVPKHSCVCISTVGCVQNKDSYHRFLQGYEKALEVTEPEQVIIYGKVTKEMQDMRKNIYRVPSYMEERKKHIALVNELKETPIFIETKKKTLLIDMKGVKNPSHASDK